MPHPLSPRRPWPLTATRFTGSLLALLALVVGIPLVLAQVGTLPAGIPTLDGLGQGLLAPDDGGQVLFTILTLICWALWAWFVLSLLVEAGALLRRRRAPRIRGLAAPQRLAAVLLGGLLFLPPATALAAPATATAAPAATATHLPTAAHTTAAVPQQQVASQHAGPTHTVGATGETVWDLAEHYLGDGRRHSELRALNPHLPDTATLPTGTVVRLPADARTGLAPQDAETRMVDAGTGKKQARHETYTVASGDSLYEIADKKLGDGDRWTDLYKANRQEIRDPDLIYPGQELDLPTQHAAPTPAPPKDRTGSDHRGDGEAGGHGGGATATPAPPHQQAGGQHTGSGTQSDGHASGTATPAPRPSTPAPTTGTHSDADAGQAPSPAVPTPTTAPKPEAEGRVTPAAAAIGGGVLAAALLSAVTTRRILQQRRRHRGQRIALPKDDTAAVEQSLRTAEAALDTSMLDGALRTAAVHLAGAGRALPSLSAAVIGPREIVLHLTEPVPPVPPFTASPDALERWTCPTHGGELLPQAQTDDVDAPYPALASLGWDERGQLILIDLENVGHLHLTGPDRHRVLRTLALELAASEFADHLTVCPVADAAPGLVKEMPERVIERADLREALEALRAHHVEQQRALTVLETGSLRRARTGADTAAAWTPHCVLAGDLDTEEAEAAKALEGLQEVIAQPPRSATVVVITGPKASDSAHVLHADTAAGPIAWTLPGTEVEVWCSLQALTDEHYDQALEVLATTRADDVPAPRPVVTAPKAVPDAPQEPLPEPPSTEGEAVVATGRNVFTKWVEPSSASTSLMAQFATYDDTPDTKDRQGQEAPSGEAGKADATVEGTSEDASEPDHSPSVSQVSMAKAPEAHDSPEPTGVETAGDGPVVRMLGPVDVVGARGTIESKRERTCVELATYLVLHPGRDHHSLDEAMWPGRTIDRKYRNATVSRLRSWLGTDDHGEPYLPAVANTTDVRYALAGTVDSDWHYFQRLTVAAATASGPKAAVHLRAALDLVRGRPFAGVNPRRYAWAEHQTQDMISAIVDAAADLAEHHLTERDPRGALWAATKGLDAAPEMESLYRILFRAYAAIGDYEALERAAERLDDLNMQLGVDMEDATATILTQIKRSA
ncbi:LysM peptidoglycan-binding domain-containing protein [Streptomyces sp. RGM 3693]|uniref:LysM peptidoglycan-binding domain-containing protein n=1 Tax=Streptomyces sp. RGM 3693 TaxID=3413284 RepID=UPI003D284DB1